ncbi:Fur family transcriptional regulator [Aerococcus urinaehominis]|uniref:Fur family transcriptional regulator n=1 Tax=Aerococcus urinaehominis TaxID=128944 RepID=A0A0X8FJL5_9LACT|nr:Fur family transcriptional regulator [Aerococcus urinaehominis]AMB98519.1 Fur family transcriptional regulator [Aerococcus urinaehominis]SDL79741.1 Fur family transcriptional regulator, zinc uptake regulator [Aerococcus urinaehominis]
MADFVQEAMTQLKEAGYKYTQRRADLLAVFAGEDHDRAFTAHQVQEAIADKYPNMSFDTIYRNLKLFADHHLLEETDLNGEMIFTRHCSPHLGHHHFICTNCGKTIPIHHCPMDIFVDQLPGCKIQGHRFEIQGLCPDCNPENQ